MIFITSYPYVYERHLRLFDFFRDKKNLTFILPRAWRARSGIVHPPHKPDLNIITTPAFFSHSHYPLIRGLMKGFMPLTYFILRKHAKPGDVLLTSNEPNLLVTYINALIAKAFGMKHVCITWQNISYERRLHGIKKYITDFLIHQNLKLAGGFICGTQTAYDLHKPYFSQYPNLKVLIAPQSGVDVDLFVPDVPNDFRAKYHLEDRLIYLFGAVFDERKGVFTTIEAFEKTLSAIPNAHLVMIGIGKLWEQARDMVREKNMQDHVTFIQWLPNHELAGIFAASDVLVHPSEPYRDWEEQFGWTMLQAASSALPVIATRMGSIPEAVLDEQTGILVEPKRPDQLAEAMIRLGTDPQLRARMGQAGREYVSSKLSHQAVATRMEDFLKNL